MTIRENTVSSLKKGCLQRQPFSYCPLADSLQEKVVFLFMEDPSRASRMLSEKEVVEEKRFEQCLENRRSTLRKIIGSSIAFLIGGILEGDSSYANIDRDGQKDYIDIVEINRFGPEDPGRIAILYRDPDGSVVDWRWYTTPKQIPRSLGDGRYIAVWEDQGCPRIIITPNAPRFRRTREDIELQERAILPVERRRKLSK